VSLLDADKPLAKEHKGSENVEIQRSKLEILGQFDRSYLILHALQYFNAGFRSLIHLSVNYMFKDHFKLDPSLAQEWTVVMTLPWSFKLIYGLISDNVVLFGSRKKVFIVLGALLQFTCL